MIIYEHMKCDKCGRAYKGKYIFTCTGSIECFDCERNDEVQEIQWENVTDEGTIDAQLFRETVQEMLLEDVERIYKSESVRGEDYTEIFFKKDGTMDRDKLYYQHNPFDLVIEAQQKAYSALRYLEGTETEYIAVAEKVVAVYKQFRETKLTEQELADVWGLYLTEEVEMMLRSSES